MTDLVPREAGVPDRSRSTGVGATGVARVQWGPTVDRLGWDLMPEEIRSDLAAAGVCAGDGLAAWADSAGVRRTGESHAQCVEGWWVDTSCFVAVEARRIVVAEAPGSRRFRPSGRWKARAIVRPVSGTTETQRWRRPSPSAPPPAGGSVRSAGSPIEVLPAAVRHRLGAATQWGAGRYALGNGSRERIVAYRQDGDRLVVVSAERRAGAFPDPASAIDLAPWVTTFLEGTTGPAAIREVGG